MITLSAIALFSAAVGVLFGIEAPRRRERATDTRLSLPSPRRTGALSVEAAMAERRSRREYGAGSLTVSEVGQLLWATHGITDRSSGFRSAPSTGPTYPLEVHVIVGEDGVDGLATGIYPYDPDSYSLTLARPGDHGVAIREVALDQEWVGQGAIYLVISAVDARTTARYGQRGERRYVPMEAGHAGQNVCLQAEALDLAVVSVGAFHDEQLRAVLDEPDGQRPLSTYPVGRRLR